MLKGDYELMSSGFGGVKEVIDLYQKCLAEAKHFQTQVVMQVTIPAPQGRTSSNRLTCSYTYSRGLSKGVLCNKPCDFAKTFCKVHNKQRMKYINKSETSFYPPQGSAHFQTFILTCLCSIKA